MFYLYKITYWEAEAEEYGEKYSISAGLCFASSYAEAANKIIKDYGPDVIDIYLQRFGDSPQTLTKEEVLEAFKEEK